MKILGIVGSKRKEGNTAALIDNALKSAEANGVDTQIIYLSDYNIQGCNGCEGCKYTCKCVVDDDMQKLYPLILQADAIILGSPTYFYNITSDMKAFIERLYCYEIFDKDDRSVWMSLNEAIGIKYASVIAICEQNNEHDMGFTAEAMKMPLEALGYRVIDVVKVLHLFKKGEAQQSNTALEQARISGEKLAKTLLLRKEIVSKIN